MVFKNLETGMIWTVTNPDRIKELENSDKYVNMAVETTSTKQTKPLLRKKESK